MFEKPSDHAVHLVMSYEKYRGRNPINVSKSRRYGIDVVSDGRMIEVKSVAKSKPSFVVLNSYNIKALELAPDNYFWLYVVHDANDPKIIELSKEDILVHRRPETSWIIPIHSSDRKLDRVI